MPKSSNETLEPASAPVLSTKCAQCGRTLIGPEWSENVADGRCVHIWQCPVCSCEFETTDSVVEKAESDAELAEEFLPNLLVA
jgi:hypothetical protein